MLLLLLVMQLALSDGWSALSWLPVALGLLLGLPHGAVDHLVPAWVGGRRSSPRGGAALVVGYVVTAAVVYGLFRCYPLPALLVFLAASGVHFGTGERQYDRLRRPSGAARGAVVVRGTAGRVRTGARAAVAVLAWGGASVLLPLACWPGPVRPVLEGLAPGSAPVLLAPGVRHAAAAVVLTAAAATAACDARQRRYRSALELSLLVAVFVLVPPLVAFAGYFGAWHATRHIVRLLAADPANADQLAAGRLAGPVLRFARSAAWPTAAALVVLAVLLTTAHGAGSSLAAYLSLLAALTAPHLLLVAWLDRQGSRPVPGRVSEAARQVQVPVRPVAR